MANPNTIIFVSPLYILCIATLVFALHVPRTGYQESLGADRLQSMLKSKTRSENISFNTKGLMNPLKQSGSQKDIANTTKEETFEIYSEKTSGPTSNTSTRLSRGSLSHTSATSHVPQYMMDLYQHLNDKKVMPRYDTARSFTSINRGMLYPHKDVSVDQEPSKFHTRIHTLWFNISKLPEYEKMEMAQLRLYTTMDGELMNYFGNRTFIKVFHATDGGEKRLVASRRVLQLRDSWQTFNVTSVVKIWLLDSGRQQRLEIHVEGVRHASLPDTAAIVLSRDSDTEPQVLVFSITVSRPPHYRDPVLIRMRRALKISRLNQSEGRDSQNALNEWDENEIFGHSIHKRSEEEEEESEEMSNYITGEPGKIKKGKTRRKKNPCRRKPLHVNFADISYDRWIIAPPSYEAFECTGKCSVPMSAHLTPTKHAIIQTLMHDLEPKGVSRACCVPTKLSPISVLYLDDDGVVTYKYEYEDMVVTECGCR